MAGHSSEKRWRSNQNDDSGTGVSALVATAASTVIDGLSNAEIMYQDLTELFAYVGSTNQLLADQLFYEDWTKRSTLGTQAVITVDVVGNAVTNPTVTVAGSGYLNGTGFTVLLTATAGGGDGLAEITYDVVAGSVTNATVSAAGSTYTNGTDTTVTELPAATEQVFETQASTIEVTKTQDLINAVTAMHELYQAGDNVAVAQENRFAQLRRMT